MTDQYPRTGSILSNAQLNATGGVDGQNGNRTGMSLSTMILVTVGTQAVGAIQDINISERRDVRKIAEVGTDGIIDSAPNKAAEISGSCSRIRFDRLRISESFGRGFIHVHSQRIPFDISIIDFFGFSESADATIVTTIKNVWITNISYNYQANDYIITDKMDWTAEAIFSQLQSANQNVATGGAIGLTVYADPIERAADIGNRRGALDAPGLLNAVYQAY